MDLEINEHGARVILEQAEKLLQQALDKIKECEEKMSKVRDAEVEKLTAEMHWAQSLKQFTEAKIEEMKKLLDS